MHKIFIDSDIILDVLAKRNPFYLHAAGLFTLIEQNKISAYTSPLVFSNIHYILRKLTSKEYAIQHLRKIRLIIDLLVIDEKIIDLALYSDFTDFEDAIQYYAAKNNEINFIITRNKKDYEKESIIAICTAEEYLNIWRTISKHRN